MGDVNKKLKEEIDYLSRLIDSHKYKARHSTKPFVYPFPGPKNFRENSTITTNFPCSSGRIHGRSFNRANLHTKLIKNENVKINRYKIDRTLKNNKSVFVKTQPEASTFSHVGQNKVIHCHSAPASRRSVVVKSASNFPITPSVTLKDVVKQTPVLVTLCDNTKSVSVEQRSEKLPLEITVNKWPNSLTVAKSADNMLQVTKQKPLGCDFLANKSVLLNKIQLPRLIKARKNNSILKTKYKVINGRKHEKFIKNTSRSHYFRSNEIMERNLFQNVQSHSLPWKITAANQWNVSRKCGNSNWKKPYFNYGSYQSNIFKKNQMQKRRWKMQFAASHRKLNAGSRQIVKRSTVQPRMVIIGGLLYKASKMKLSRASKSFGKQITQNKMQLQTLLIRGIRYQMDASGKTLKRLPNQRVKKGSSTSTVNLTLKRVYLGGSTYIQTQPGILTKTDSAQARTFVNRVVNRSIYRVLAATEKKTRSKNNLYCMFYNRFGRCNKGHQCPYKHDPDKIAVCSRFLRGTCKVVDCPFSHKVAPEKMPVCLFYLQGRCNSDNCPYRHVKVSRSAEVCKDFLRGYCPLGQKCKKRHVLTCQEYVQKGNCKNGNKCPMHHPQTKGRKRKLSRCNISLESSAAKETSELKTNLALKVPPSNDSIDPSKILSPLPSFIALERNEKKDCSPIKSAVKGETLRIRPCFLSKGTLGVTSLPVSQVSKNVK